eukprot:364442-Chlamydomonas_euryale.AAC.5
MCRVVICQRRSLGARRRRRLRGATGRIRRAKSSPRLTFAVSKECGPAGMAVGVGGAAARNSTAKDALLQDPFCVLWARCFPAAASERKQRQRSISTCHLSHLSHSLAACTLHVWVTMSSLWAPNKPCAIKPSKARLCQNVCGFFAPLPNPDREKPDRPFHCPCRNAGQFFPVRCNQTKPN